MSGPQLMREQTVDGMALQIFYHAESHTFTVSVADGDKVKTESFHANYEPTFGMDVSDMDIAYTLAEQLAVQLDKERE